MADAEEQQHTEKSTTWRPQRTHEDARKTVVRIFPKTTAEGTETPRRLPETGRGGFKPDMAKRVASVKYDSDRYVWLKNLPDADAPFEGFSTPLETLVRRRWGEYHGVGG